jgi:membrane protein YqaA with SNARE-associated domain
LKKELTLSSIIFIGLLELFIVSAAASVVPIPTEPTIALLLSENVIPLVVLFVLVPASVLGAFVAYLLGKYGIRRIIPFHNPDRERRVKIWFDKYGAALLLVSPWIPFASDLIPIVAGVENFKLSTFLAVTFVAKVIKGVATVYFLSYCVHLINLHFYLIQH